MRKTASLLPHVQFVFWLKAALSAVLLGCTAAFVAISRRWPLVGDAPLMHYVVLLMRHGMVPYREIVDLNLPGTYAAEAAVMVVLGPGAAAWRVYDLGLLLAIGLGMGAIAGRARWFAAVWAGCVFALVHGRDGLIDTGQRDLLLTALVVWACAFLLKGRMLWCGLLLGAAATVKPLALVLLPVFLLAGPVRRGWTAVAGATLPVLAMVVALLHWRAWGAFLGVTGELVPLHTSMFRLPWGKLVLGSVSSVLLWVFLLAVPVALRVQVWKTLSGRVLLAGFAFGVFSFVVQGRGYPYHRYPSEAFLLLLAGLAFEEGLRDDRRWLAAVCLAGILFGAAWVVPRSLAAVRHFDLHDEFGAMLRQELEALGGAGLNGRVQCLDQAGGCVAGLYNAGIMQSTGYLYDCYLFVQPTSQKQVENQAWYRRAFWNALERKQPKYLIVTSDECGLRAPDFTYSKLTYWPEFAHWLEGNYQVLHDQRPEIDLAWGGKPIRPYGFRIYRRKTP